MSIFRRGYHLLVGHFYCTHLCRKETTAIWLRFRNGYQSQFKETTANYLVSFECNFAHKYKRLILKGPRQCVLYLWQFPTQYPFLFNWGIRWYCLMHLKARCENVCHGLQTQIQMSCSEHCVKYKTNTCRMHLTKNWTCQANIVCKESW